MTRNTESGCQEASAADHVLLWGNLLKLNGSLAILKFSMFFLRSKNH